MKQEVLTHEAVLSSECISNNKSSLLSILTVEREDEKIKTKFRGLSLTGLERYDHPKYNYARRMLNKSQKRKNEEVEKNQSSTKKVTNITSPQVNSKISSLHKNTETKQGVLITFRGMEDIAAQEISEKIKRKAVLHSSFAEFSYAKEEELIALAYQAQSARHIMHLLAYLNHKNEKPELIISNIFHSLDITKIKNILKPSTLFNIICLKENYSSDLSSPDIASLLAQKIAEVTKAAPSYKDPVLTFILCLTPEYAVFGLDVAGFDLSKRDYKIFLSAHTLKGPVAYALIRIAEYDSSQIFLDPFCGCGIIPIEAALFSSQKSPHFFSKNKFPENNNKNLEKIDIAKKSFKGTIWAIGDGFHHISSTKKNAKIAGIYEFLNYSRTEIDYLDAKFEGNTFHCIITSPPLLSQNSDEKKIRKLYDQFFKEAFFLLKKKGKLVLISQNFRPFLPYAEAEKLKFVSQRSIWQGKEELHVLVFEK